MGKDEQENSMNDTRNVLIVDDETVIREGMRRILENDGYHVELSASGKAAIEKIQEQHFHLVITDLKMPGMDGIEVLKTIKILQPDVPVIIITGYVTVDTAVEAMRNGAVDYLAKPFTPDQISEKVRKAVAQIPKFLQTS
jgi:DNA-binding NtrC family response regulator